MQKLVHYEEPDLQIVSFQLSGVPEETDPSVINQASVDVKSLAAMSLTGRSTLYTFHTVVLAASSLNTYDSKQFVARTMFDTGADAELISRAFLTRHGLTKVITASRSPRMLEGFNGSRVVAKDLAKLTWIFQPESPPRELLGHVVELPDDGPDILLGSRFLQKHGLLVVQDAAMRASKKPVARVCMVNHATRPVNHTARPTLSQAQLERAEEGLDEATDQREHPSEEPPPSPPAYDKIYPKDGIPTETPKLRPRRYVSTPDLQALGDSFLGELLSKTMKHSVVEIEETDETVMVQPKPEPHLGIWKIAKKIADLWKPLLEIVTLEIMVQGHACDRRASLAETDGLAKARIEDLAKAKTTLCKLADQLIASLNVAPGDEPRPAVVELGVEELAQEDAGLHPVSVPAAKIVNQVGSAPAVGAQQTSLGAVSSSAVAAPSAEQPEIVSDAQVEPTAHPENVAHATPQTPSSPFSEGATTAVNPTPTTARFSLPTETENETLSKQRSWSLDGFDIPGNLTSATKRWTEVETPAGDMTTESNAGNDTNMVIKEGLFRSDTEPPTKKKKSALRFARPAYVSYRIAASLLLTHQP